MIYVRSPFLCVHFWPASTTNQSDVGYLCANFSLPIGLSVLELCPLYATDRQTDRRTDRRQTKASLNAPAY